MFSVSVPGSMFDGEIAIRQGRSGCAASMIPVVEQSRVTAEPQRRREETNGAPSMFSRCSDRHVMPRIEGWQMRGRDKVGRRYPAKTRSTRHRQGRQGDNQECLASCGGVADTCSHRRLRWTGVKERYIMAQLILLFRFCRKRASVGHRRDISI